jgi:hypothetical protein
MANGLNHLVDLLDLWREYTRSAAFMAKGSSTVLLLSSAMACGSVVAMLISLVKVLQFPRCDDDPGRGELATRSGVVVKKRWSPSITLDESI